MQNHPNPRRKYVLLLLLVLLLLPKRKDPSRGGKENETL